MNRYIVSGNLPPEKRREGYRAEIVDTTHPSDGGPVAIEWFASATVAQLRADALNEREAELAFEARS